MASPNRGQGTGSEIVIDGDPDGPTAAAAPARARAEGRAEGRAEKPTLKTIARATGLAVATVSRALGDAPDLRADTKARVARVAAELGYVPNRAGLRLRTGRR